MTDRLIPQKLVDCPPDNFAVRKYIEIIVVHSPDGRLSAARFRSR
jgi:hypothetical protein